MAAYKRILLKLSGEALMGGQSFGVEPSACLHIAEAIKEIRAQHIQIGVVIGAGNIFRAAQNFHFARVPADHIGMLATAVNGLILQETLTSVGCKSRIMSVFPCSPLIEVYDWAHAMEALNRDTVLIFVGGTGHPYFTTDTAAALRASELSADVLLKATKVDGIYDKDPLKYSDAIKYERLTYSDALSKQLSVMDAAALALCRENKIPVCVFNLFEKGSLLRAAKGQQTGSLVTGENHVRH